MPTYSLTLREPLNRRLSIEEVDNNWLYLEQLALSGATGSIDLGESETFLLNIGGEIGNTGLYDVVGENILIGSTNSLSVNSSSGDRNIIIGFGQPGLTFSSPTGESRRNTMIGARKVGQQL